MADVATSFTTSIIDAVHSAYVTVTSSLGYGMLSYSQTLLARLMPFILLTLSIYMLMVVWDYYNRGVDESIGDFSKRLAGWFFIILLAANAANYMKLATALYGMPDELSQFITGTPITANLFDDYLSSVVDNLASMFSAMNDATFGGKLLLGFSLIVTALSSVVSIGLVLGMYLVSKACLALVLVVGPLFIACLLYPVTRQYGMNWISQVFNYGLTIALYSVVMSAFVDLVGRLEPRKEPTKVKVPVEHVTAGRGDVYYTYDEKTVDAVTVNSAADYALSVLILSLVGIVIIYAIPAIAQALTGGTAVSGGGRSTPLGTLGKAASAPFKAMSGAKNMIMAPFRAQQAQRSQARTIAMAAKMLKDQSK